MPLAHAKRRRPREGGDPVSLSSRLSQRPIRHWVPAFAGTTNVPEFSCSWKQRLETPQLGRHDAGRGGVGPACRNAPAAGSDGEGGGGPARACAAAVRRRLRLQSGLSCASPCGTAPAHPHRAPTASGCATRPPDRRHVSCVQISEWHREIGRGMPRRHPDRQHQCTSTVGPLSPRRSWPAS